MSYKKPTKPPKPKCAHLNAFPIEWRFGRRTTSKPGEPFLVIWDWSESNMYSAHAMRAVKLYCPMCKKEISINLPT